MKFFFFFNFLFLKNLTFIFLGSLHNKHIKVVILPLFYIKGKTGTSKGHKIWSDSFQVTAEDETQGNGFQTHALKYCGMHIHVIPLTHHY